MPLIVKSLKTAIPATASARISRMTSLSDLPQLMTEAEVASYLALSLTQVVRMRYDKRGPPTIRLGYKERVRREDLIAWIDAQAAKQGCK